MLRKKIHWSITVAVVLVSLTSCSTVEQIWSPDAPAETMPVANAPENVEAIVPAAVLERTRVAILLSSGVDTYENIAKQIVQRGPDNDYQTLRLVRGDENTEAMKVQLASFSPDKIVAIGLPAVKQSRQLSSKPLVFCQVFNYQDEDLPSVKAKGVKLLPPFALQLGVWKERSPGLNTVGLIVGPNQDDLVEEIKQAAEQHEVKLLTRTVGSDKEMLYAFKRMTPQIEGFWLLPDNRVLSPSVLKEILAYARKHGTQTAVFGSQLLGLGADISFTSRDTDVADAVLKVLGNSAGKEALFGPPMTSLTTLRAESNSESPTDYRAHVNRQPIVN